MVDRYWTKIDDPPLKTWDALLARVQKLKDDAGGSRWIFRGLSSFDHNLVSTFDRAIKETREGLSSAVLSPLVVAPNERWRYEAATLFDFKRRAHYYLGRSETPDPGDFLEWFSLMRHFGAPARRLDFSYSFPVA